MLYSKIKCRISFDCFLVDFVSAGAQAGLRPNRSEQSKHFSYVWDYVHVETEKEPNDFHYTDDFICMLIIYAF